MLDREVKEKDYIEVDIGSLREGMLLDRPIYIYMSSTQRFMRLINSYEPLEGRKLEKLKKLGKAYSTQKPLSQEFSEFNNAAQKVKDALMSEDLAPFEKNKQIHDATKWLIEHTITLTEDLWLPVFFINSVLDIPSTETLLFISDCSMEMYEKSLKVSGVVGCLSLWLGYSDFNFLKQFVSSVFAREAGRYKQGIRLNSPLQASQLVRGGVVPGLKTLDYRFKPVLDFDSVDDELSEIVLVAQWLCGHVQLSDVELKRSRVLRKISQQFEIKIDKLLKERRAAA